MTREGRKSPLDSVAFVCFYGFARGMPGMSVDIGVPVPR